MSGVDPAKDHHLTFVFNDLRVFRNFFMGGYDRHFLSLHLYHSLAKAVSFEFNKRGPVEGPKEQIEQEFRGVGYARHANEWI